jgi:hypothetical protein
MAWTRIDDSFYDHPKAARTSLAAIGLWTKALSYCARHLTDGFVPTLIVIDLARLPKDEALGLARELVHARLWKAVGVKGFKFHDYLEYNPSAKALQAHRATTAARQRRWVAKRSGQQTSESKPPTNPVNRVSNASTNGVGNTPTNAAPTPTPTPTKTPIEMLRIRSALRSDGDLPHSEVAHALGDGAEADHAQKKAHALAHYREAIIRLFPTA